MACSPSSNADPARPGSGGARATAIGAIAGSLATILVGNAVIALSSLWLQRRAGTGDRAVPIKNFRRVDERLLRGAAPSRTALRVLAGLGVSIVVDLRAERDLVVHEPLLAELGIARHSLPIRDGQVPTREQTARFDAIVDDAEGLVFLHCGAGVGRTGAVVAHHRRHTTDSRGIDRVLEALSVGPPSLEQLAYGVASSDRRPGVLVTALSRALDAPRRTWHRLH